MNVAIIGGGSIGLLFGAYLSIDHEVTMFTHKESQAKQLVEKGIAVFNDGKQQLFVGNVQASTTFAHLSSQDFIIVAVKQYDLPSLRSVLEEIPRSIPLLFIQNGMGHMELLQSLPHTCIFVGTVEHGAKRIAATSVSHNGVGKTNVALFTTKATCDEKFPTVNHPSFPFAFQNDYEQMLLSKLITNALINPLTAILQVKNGRLVANRYFYKLFQQLFDEMIAIFPSLDKEKAFQEVKMICENTKENTSSMLKDIQAGGLTEVEAILGYILGVAEQKEIVPMTIETVYYMVKGLEKERGEE